MVDTALKLGILHVVHFAGQPGTIVSSVHQPITRIRTVTFVLNVVRDHVRARADTVCIGTDTLSIKRVLPSTTHNAVAGCRTATCLASR